MSGVRKNVTLASAMRARSGAVSKIASYSMRDQMRRKKRKGGKKKREIKRVLGRFNSGGRNMVGAEASRWRVVM